MSDRKMPKGNMKPEEDEPNQKPKRTRLDQKESADADSIAGEILSRIHAAEKLQEEWCWKTRDVLVTHQKLQAIISHQELALDGQYRYAAARHDSILREVENQPLQRALQDAEIEMAALRAKNPLAATLVEYHLKGREEFHQSQIMAKPAPYLPPVIAEERRKATHLATLAADVARRPELPLENGFVFNWKS